MHSSRRTWRIRGIPRDFDRDWLARVIRHHSDLQWPDGDRLEGFKNGGNDVIIRTLAPDLRVDYQVATVRFHDLPSQLRTLGARGQLTVKINMDPENPRMIDKCDCVFEVVIDEHFDGITTLFSPVTDEEHQIDVLAVSGLGSHPFGSFVHKEDGNMWLMNNLPQDMPAARVMIFGYKSELPHSRSHVELDDLAGPLRIAISQILRSVKKKPLLLIGHSLGGLLVKQALIQINKPGFEKGLPNLLDMIKGILLFGTPNDGFHTESLVPMVNDQPNRSLLESLSVNNFQVLGLQRREFSKVLECTKLQLICFYETELSPTAIKDLATGRWNMEGPLQLLVTRSSATSCLPAGASSDESICLRRNHSDLVKFSSHDAEYERVAYILKRMQEKSTSYGSHEREPQKENSVTSQQRSLIGGTQVDDSTTRPAAEMLSFPVVNSFRLTGHLPENGNSQAGDDHALRDPVEKEKMRIIRKELIDRLYFSKIDERLTHLTSAQRTTCSWFLTKSEYQSWHDVAQQSEHGGLLWIKGNPGTGKSTLMKYLFEATKVNSQDDPSRITLPFFFLARGTTEEKTTMGLYRSLLHQLFTIAPDLKDSLEWMTADGAKTIHRNGWSEEALKQTLRYAVPKLGNRSLTIFVDALDECDENKANDMVSFFEELCDYAVETRVQVHICFSSRYYPTVVVKKGIEVSLEDEIGHTEDIRKYVKLRLRLDSKSKHAEELRSELLEKSSGIFLWVVLVVDILNNDISVSIKKLRKHLHEIPPKLNDLFQMLLNRDGDNLELLRLCLNWVLFASRALKPQELYFAIQLGFNKECTGFWDPEDVDLDDMKTFVRSSSKGLAEVTRNKDSEVQFIHESIRNFLLGKYGSQWSGTSENLEGHGHQVLRDCCFAQLNPSISQQVDIPDPLPRASRAAYLRDTITTRFPFLRYSIRNVFHHSNLAQGKGIEQGPFLSGFPLQRWIPINNALAAHNSQRYTDSVSLLYIFGKDNLADLIRNHSRRKFCFQLEGERCGAPILAALANNSRKAVWTFLRVQAENEPPTSPLHGLCEQYEQQENKRTTFGRDFTFTRRRGILYDLIDHKEDAVALAFMLSSHSHDDQKSGWLDAALLRAAHRGCEAVVRLLLEKGADIDSKSKDGQTLLSSAARWGQNDELKDLLEKGANIETRGKYGRTPLSWAAEGSIISDDRKDITTKLLLGEGADVNSRDKDGRTPLSWAAENSCRGQEIICLLLEKGADIESRDTHGRTPLSWAVGNSSSKAAVPRLLLEKGADVESKDEDGRTPLSWALLNEGDIGGTAVTKLLRGKLMIQWWLESLEVDFQH